MDYNTILYFYLYVLLKCKGRIVMSYIVDIICDGEHNLFIGMKEQCQAFYVKIFLYLIY